MLTRMLALILDEHNQLEKAVQDITRLRDIDTVVKLLFNHQVDEERLMQEAEYAEYVAHRDAHRQLVDKLIVMDLKECLISTRYMFHKSIVDHITLHDNKLIDSLDVYGVKNGQYRSNNR